jgi:hypothetical protein
LDIQQIFGEVMKSQTLIIKVDFDEDDKPPHLWNWTELLECKDCVKVLNHGAVEASENKYHICYRRA